MLSIAAFLPGGITFENYNERGLLGLACDPNFATNGYLYVYYTVCKVAGSGSCALARNRVARFTISGDAALVGSQVVLLDDIPNDAGIHNAGWVGFGPVDGKLYVSVGDGGTYPTNAQDLNSLNGKILRINRDGSIPADNPFYGQSGRRSEIWAAGLRNPWRCRFAPDGRFFCADVGQASWEEVDVIGPATNFGWPTTEGNFTQSSYPQFNLPLYTYDHTAGASIIGGDFGDRTNFPGDYQDSYFFSDGVYGWVRRLVLDASGTAVSSVQTFATGLGSIVEMIAGPDGALYYSDYYSIRRIVWTPANRSPVAQASATPSQGLPPLTVQFSSAGSSDPDGDPLTYSWNFGDGSAASTQANPSHVYAAAGPYTATLTVSDGKPSPGPGTATAVVEVGRRPTLTISQPVNGATFRGGDVITMAGSAVDPEDGALPASALHWKVIFHHRTHTHPFIDDLPGSPSTFTTFTTGESDFDVGYEIVLSATDSSGLTATTSVMIDPLTAVMTFASAPSGLQVTLDGQPLLTPTAVTGVVGFRRSIDTPSPQTSGGNTVTFASWSDGGAKSHTITTPAANQTFTASFSGGPTTTVRPTTTSTSTSTTAPTPTTTTTTLPGTSAWPPTATPPSFTGADAPVELGVKFRADVAGTVAGIRFYKGTLNTGTHTGSLWTTSGTRLATATFTGETASGWQQVTFTPPVAIAANTVYVASYFCPNGGFAISANFFAQGVDNPPLHLLADGVRGRTASSPTRRRAVSPPARTPSRTTGSTSSSRRRPPRPPPAPPARRPRPAPPPARRPAPRPPCRRPPRPRCLGRSGRPRPPRPTSRVPTPRSSWA